MKKLALVLAMAAALAACGKPADTASTTDTTASTTSSASTDTGTASSASTPSPVPSTDTTTAANSTSVSPMPSSTSPDASVNTASMGATGPGADTYTKACVVCHGAGVAGAPKLGDKADWTPRIAQGNDLLYEHAIKGYTGKKGMMPPKGGQTGLPDDDVKAAVDYMVAQSK